MTIRKAATVAITWEDGSIQVWEDVKVDEVSNAPGSLSHPLQPKTDYRSIVLVGEP